MTATNDLSLINIAGLIQSIDQSLEALGGEISPDLEAFLDTVQTQLTQKSDNYYFLIKFIEQRADFWAMKERDARRVKKSCETVIERLKDRIKAAMKIMGVDHIDGEEKRFVLSNSVPRLLIEDETLIPANYKITITVTEPDKERIKSDLMAGKDIPGVKLETAGSLRIYNNTKGSTR